MMLLTGSAALTEPPVPPFAAQTFAILLFPRYKLPKIVVQSPNVLLLGQILQSDY